MSPRDVHVDKPEVQISVRRVGVTGIRVPIQFIFFEEQPAFEPLSAAVLQSVAVLLTFSVVAGPVFFSAVLQLLLPRSSCTLDFIHLGLTFSSLPLVSVDNLSRSLLPSRVMILPLFLICQ